MTETPQETIEVVAEATRSLLDVGIVGALLIVSLAANVWLLTLLIRCYRSHKHGGDHYA